MQIVHLHEANKYFEIADTHAQDGPFKEDQLDYLFTENIRLIGI